MTTVCHSDLHLKANFLHLVFSLTTSLIWHISLTRERVPPREAIFSTLYHHKPTPTSAATLPKVSSPSCRSEMRLQWAQSKRKRRHVRLAASSLTLASSKERLRRMTAICSTRWASMSLMPAVRGGWKRLCQRSAHDVPSAERTGTTYSGWGYKHIVYEWEGCSKEGHVYCISVHLPCAGLFLSQISSLTSASSTTSFQNCEQIEALSCALQIQLIIQLDPNSAAVGFWDGQTASNSPNKSAATTAWA